MFNPLINKELLIYIANLIYDLAFKYMMEGKRVANILLSALLQQMVVDMK